MKNKKLVRIILCFCMLFSVLVLFSACKKDCEHTYGDWQIVENNTCTENGTKSRKCTKCDYEDVDIIPAGHTLDAIAEVPASCITGVMAHDHCTVCNKDFVNGVEKNAEDLILDIVGHVYHNVAKVNPTCVENGMLAHICCYGCNKKYIRGVEYTSEELVIPATHNVQVIKAKASTCESDGWVEYKCCRDCNKIFIGNEEKTLADTVIPASHSIQHIGTINSTCTTSGMLEHDYCPVCKRYWINSIEKNYFELIVEKSAHNYGNLIGETQSERTHYTCLSCHKNFNEGYEEISSLNKLDGHTLVWHDKEVGTCENVGKKGHYVCSDADCGKKYSANYEELGYYDLENEHPYDGYNYDKNGHWQVCSLCHVESSHRAHTLETKHLCREGVWYEYKKCQICGYSEPEIIYNSPYQFEIKSHFIVGRHTYGSSISTEYQVYVYGSEYNDYEYLMNMIPDDSNFATKLAEMEEMVENGNTTSFPYTYTFLLRLEEYEQEVSITFDIERKNVDFRYPVYGKGTINSLEDLVLVISSNYMDYWKSEPRYEESYIRLGDTTITNNGGFSIDDDCPDGSTYTIQFTYNGNSYESSFVYINDEGVMQEIRSISTEVCRGQNPEVELRYRGGSNSNSNYNNLKIVGGSFDKNTVGTYTVTFQTRNGFSKPVTVTIVVRDEKDVKTIFKGDGYYMPLGANGFSVEVEYFDGTSGYEWIPLASITEYVGEKLNPNKIGTYSLVVEIGDRSKEIDVTVYNAEEKLVSNIYSYLDSSQYLVCSKDDNNNIQFDLSGLYIVVEYNDGSYEFVPMTAKMITCVEDGNNVIATVSYAGKTCSFNAVISEDSSLEGFSLYYVMVDGNILDRGVSSPVVLSQLHTGRFDKTYTLVLKNADNEIVYIELKPDMIYFGGNNNYGYDGLANLSTTMADYYDDTYIMIGDKNIGKIELFVYEADKINSTICFNDDTIHLVAGTKNDIINQMNGRTFYYREVYRTRTWGDMAIYKEYLDYGDITLGDVAKLNFDDYGDIEIPIQYRGRTTYLSVYLIPNFDMYTSKTFIDEYDKEFVFYSNGYYETKNAQYRHVGTYEYLNDAKNIASMHNLPYDGATEGVYFLDETTGMISEVRCEGNAEYTKVGRYFYGYILFTMFEKDGIYYAEVYQIYGGPSGEHAIYDYTMVIDYDADNNIFEILGEQYTVDTYSETYGYYILSIVISGKALYQYIEEDDYKCVYHDNGKVYCYYYYDDEGEWVCEASWSWRYNEDMSQIIESAYGREKTTDVSELIKLF